MAPAFLIATAVSMLLGFEAASYFWYSAFCLNLLWTHDWSDHA